MVVVEVIGTFHLILEHGDEVKSDASGRGAPCCSQTGDSGTSEEKTSLGGMGESSRKYYHRRGILRLKV